ncbi:MAG: hypothetical protein WCY92_12790 [Novosphingobium sp.]
MKNIELFNEYAAAIFATLYERFPVKQSLDAREICGHHTVDDFGGVVDDSGRPSRAFDIALSTVEWLGDNGFIALGDRHNFGFRDVVLTAKGLETLNARPDSLGGKESFGERILRLLREGSIEVAKETGKAAIAYGTKAML